MLIRYSVLQAFLECPKAAYDRYVLNKIETEQSAALNFGTAMHLGIRTTLEGENGVEAFNMYWSSIKDTPMKYYDQSWGDLKDLAEHFLGNWKSRHAKKFTEFSQEVQMEMPFLKSDGLYAGVPTKKAILPDYHHILQGTADYIGMYEGKLTIADWKTSSKPYPKNKIELNLQLYIYAKLYKHKTGKLPEQLLYKVFNKKTGDINTLKKDLTESYMNATFESIEHVARAMLQCFENKTLWHGSGCYCERF